MIRLVATRPIAPYNIHGFGANRPGWLDMSLWRV